MFFTSRRPYADKNSKKAKQSEEHIYYSEFDKNSNQWSEATPLDNIINVPGRNNSAIALSNDGQRMLVYRDDINGNGDIYESILEGNNWTQPISLGQAINSKYHESSASISPDGRTIYFVSDRPGGKGGRDIWYCTQDAKGKWSKAFNIGLPVNTDHDEEGVFIHPDGKTLYFSSKGHGGYGGNDIFKSVMENNKWSKPVNLGKPLNTQDDDVFFVIEANGKTAYYSSSAKGGLGEKDIYQVNFIPIEKENPEDGPKLCLLKGIISDELDGKPIQASIEIMDNEKNLIISTLTSNSETGKYLVSLPFGKNYGINVNAKAYLFHSENFNISDTASYIEVTKEIHLKKINVGKKIKLNNIFYDFDKASIRQESIPELEHLVTLLNENPSLKIQISSHTDNKGSDDYNLKLSQARAQSVVDYLITKNINKDRLTAKGYGESQAVSENDTENGRQANRRTEFIILSK